MPTRDPYSVQLAGGQDLDVQTFRSSDKRWLPRSVVSILTALGYTPGSGTANPRAAFEDDCGTSTRTSGGVLTALSFDATNLRVYVAPTVAPGDYSVYQMPNLSLKKALVVEAIVSVDEAGAGANTLQINRASDDHALAILAFNASRTTYVQNSSGSSQQTDAGVATIGKPYYLRLIISSTGEHSALLKDMAGDISIHKSWSDPITPADGLSVYPVFYGDRAFSIYWFAAYHGTELRR